MPIFISCARWLFVVALLVDLTAAHAADVQSIERGKYIFDAADCGGCHGSDRGTLSPSGGLGLDTPFGVFHVPNITPDQQHGIGAWTEAEFHAALRSGIGRKGEYLFPVFPFTSFTNMTDRDISDLYAYLMTLPEEPDVNKPHQVKAPFNWRPLLVFWRGLFFIEGPRKIEPHKGADWNRGNYLVHAITHCEECHTPRNIFGALKMEASFAGNIGGPDGMNAPNITTDNETGIGTWSIEDIQTLLKSGMTPDSDMVGSGMKAVVRGTSQLTEADRHAIAVYLKALPPVHTPALPAKLSP